MRRRDAIAALTLAAAGVAAQLDGLAPAAQLGPKQLAVLLLRVLAYDRNLKARTGGIVAPILVLYQEGNQASEAMQVDVVSALDELAGTVAVSGLAVRVSALAYTGLSELGAQLAASRPAAIFVCAGLGDAVPGLALMTRKRSILSLTMSAAYIKAGLSIAVVRGDEHVLILVNLPASRAEGADLDAALLRLAEVYR